MRGLTKTKRTVAVAAGLMTLIACTGVAYAYWTSGGSGTGTATTGDGTALVVHQTTTVTGMFPGDSPQDLGGDFDNTSSGPIHVSTVTVSIASVTVGGVIASGCSAADYSVVGAAMDADQNVPVGNAVGEWDGATIQFNDTDANQDACEGATVNLSYAVA